MWAPSPLAALIGLPLWQLALWIAIFLFSALVVYGFHPIQRWRYRAIPGPPPRWLLGNLAEIAAKGQHAAYEDWGRQYGPVFKILFGGTAVIVMEDPAAVRKAVRVSAWRAGIRFLSVGKEREFDSYNIIASRGESWRAAHNAWHPFFSKASLDSFFPLMVQSADRLIQVLGEYADSGQEVDVHREFGKLALDVVGTTAFGVDFRTLKPKLVQGTGEDEAGAAAADSRAEKLAESIRTIFDSFGLINIWMILMVLFPHLELLVRIGANIFPAAPSARKAGDARQVMFDVAADLLRQHRKSATSGGADSSKSFLALQTRASNKLTGEPFPDLWVTAQVLTFIAGGYETTASALATSVYELAAHPEKESKLLAEIDAFGRDRVPGVDDLKEFPYAAAVWKEALRLHPPGAVNAREMQRDIVLGDHHLPKGTTVHGSVYSMHRSPLHWKDPEAFVPERFLEGAPEAEGDNLDAWMAFGDGPRRCIGYGFANQEGVATLVRVYQQLVFRLTPGQIPLKMKTALAHSPKEGVKVTVHRR